MSISRRKFMQVGAVTLIAAGVPAVGANLVLGQEAGNGGPLTAGEIPYASQKDAVFYFTKDTFVPYINSTFSIANSEGRRANLRLIAVDEYAPPPNKNVPVALLTTSFSLYFTGGKQVMPQDNFVVTHDALGTFNLLIVPIVSRDTQMYQAVINHLK